MLDILHVIFLEHDDDVVEVLNCMSGGPWSV
jgi:hypothetical protein